MTEARELPPPKDAVDLYPESEWLNYKHLRGAEPTLTIADIGRREVLKRVKRDGKTQDVWVIEGFVIFEQTERMKAARIPCKLSLNVTNRKALETMFGETDIRANWIGKRVTLTTGKARNPGLGKIAPCVRFKGSPDIVQCMSYSVAKQKSAPDVYEMIPTGKASP